MKFQDSHFNICSNILCMNTDANGIAIACAKNFKSYVTDNERSQIFKAPVSLWPSLEYRYFNIDVA